MADWFAPKRYGVGAGLPIAWQGWAILILFLALVFGSAWLFGDRPLIVLALLFPATTAMLLITARTTRGGWRWRWGERD